MKNILVTSLIAASAALLSFAGPAQAGMLTLDPDSPTFTPAETFTDNTIEADMTIGFGALIHLEGTTTITPPDTGTASIGVSGTYSAFAGDIFSVAYSFAADLATDTPVTYTITADLDGTPIPPITGTIEPGTHIYSDAVQAPLAFPVDNSGTFTGTMTLDFGTGGAAPLAAAPGTLDLTLQQLDFKLDPLAAAPSEPSLAQNISTRVNVGTGENVLIGGFIITGNDSKLVVFRGIGPSLSNVTPPVAGALADPVITLYDENGAAIATNDETGWITRPTSKRS